MRKLNHPQPRTAVSARPELQPATSWMPRGLVHTAALDPTTWSERSRQARQWKFIEAQRQRLH